MKKHLLPIGLIVLGLVSIFVSSKQKYTTKTYNTVSGMTGVSHQEEYKDYENQTLHDVMFYGGIILIVIGIFVGLNKMGIIELKK